MLRVKNGPCAPLRFSSMLSRPATGITSIVAIAGVPLASSWVKSTLQLEHTRIGQGDNLLAYASLTT